MIKTFLTIFALSALAAGCTDTERARFGALGSSGTVVCYSGGHEFYRGTSTGKIHNAEHSDGYEFKDAATGKLVRVQGDCLVQN